jgi:hypothetical protein
MKSTSLPTIVVLTGTWLAGTSTVEPTVLTPKVLVVGLTVLAGTKTVVVVAVCAGISTVVVPTGAKVGLTVGALFDAYVLLVDFLVFP